MCEVMGKVVILEMKTGSYEKRQRTKQFNRFIHEGDKIMRVSMEMLDQMWPLREPVKMIGLRLSELRKNPKS